MGINVAIGVVIFLALVRATRPTRFVGRFLRQLVLGAVRLFLGISVGR
ncbi:hypothetical protein HY251_15690 [bacterium]|nr:hypothetical protein [bacterium]